LPSAVAHRRVPQADATARFEAKLFDHPLRDSDRENGPFTFPRVVPPRPQGDEAPVLPSMVGSVRHGLVHAKEYPFSEIFLLQPCRLCTSAQLMDKTGVPCLHAFASRGGSW
jgi:hypothetical protein